MKTFNLLSTMMLFVAGLCLAATQAMATPLVDTLNVQGYMKKANGTAVTDGTYTMAIGVFQNGAAIWAKQYAVTVTNGLFSQALSSTGSDFSASVPVNVGTGMHANFSAATLNPALLSGAASGEVMIRVFSITAIDGANPQFDIALGATPTSMVAATAQSVEAGSVTLAGIAATSKSNVGGGGAANKLGLLDATGLFDITMIPALPASQIGSGSVGVGHGGTGSVDGSVTGTGAIVYQSAAGNSTTIGNNATTSSVVIQSGTGGISQSVTGATGNISFTAGSTSGGLTLTPGTTSGAVTIGSGTSSGASSFGNAGGASATTITSGTGHILLSPVGAGTVRLTNTNGLNFMNGTGNISIRAPLNPTTYAFTLPPDAGTNGYVLKTDGAGVSTWGQIDITAAVTGALPIANGGTNNAALPVTAGGVLYTDGTKVMNVGVGTTSQVLQSNGAGAPSWVSLGAAGFASSGANSDITSLNPTGTLALGGAATTAVNVLPTGANALVDIASNGTGLLTVGGAGTGASVFGNNGGASTTTVRSGTGNILLSPGGTGSVELTNAAGLKLDNGAGNVSVTSQNSGSWIFQLPTNFGVVGQFLTTDGTGIAAWTSIGLGSSSVSGTLGIGNGGTGAATAPLARAALGAAASGANGDITSLTGITTAIPIAEGGTGAITAPLARAALSAAVSGANGDITSLTNITGQITSTLATGTAPFVVASTTTVANLSASSLNGATFASPGAIGGGAASAGTFTTLSGTTSVTSPLFSNGAAATTTVGDNTSTSTTTIRSGSGGISLTPANLAAAGGAVTIAGGASTGAVGGAASLSGGTSTNPTSAGGAASMSGGAGNTTGNGGAVNLTGGTAGATGVGGALALLAGPGGATSGNGGAASLTAGSSTSGTGGLASVTGGASAAGVGGGLTLGSGAGAGTNAGGAVSITSGAGGNGSVAGLAGAISIAPGAAGTTASTPGAAVNITGGATATTGAVGTGGNVNLTGGASTLGFGGSIVVTPGAGGAANGNGTFRGVKAAYSGGTQAISGTGGAFNITTADGSSAIFFTVNTSNTTTATINGCSTGVYPQGALLTVIVVGGGGAFSWTVTNATMAALAVDQILLNGAVTYATAATANGTARGSSLTLMCSTVNAVKAWVEVGRNIHLL